jgi:hypothetical protein
VFLAFILLMLVYSKLDKNKIKIKHCISVAANCAGAVYDVCCFFMSCY